jgi:F0F1-type ATP synthase membrane subunit b/b'
MTALIVVAVFVNWLAWPEWKAAMQRRKDGI